MTDINITLSGKEIQELVENNVHDNLTKIILTRSFNQLMEQQRDHYVGVGDYERSGNRVSYRNGYYPREYKTRVGTLELRVPRTRDGKFSPDIFQRYERNEKSLIGTILEMYVAGVSTRKVKRITEELCGFPVSKSFVSSLTKELDAEVKAWQYSSLANASYPYVMVDVLFIKVRENGRVIPKSCHIAVGISDEGRREVIGFMVQDGETEETWTTFFEYLKERGLKDVKLLISDAHKGLVAATRKSFAGCSWQRCQVHFVRNIFYSVPKKDTKYFREQVKAIFRLENIDEARIAKDVVIEKFGDDKKYEQACTILDEGFDDAFQYAVSDFPHYRLRSTNILERLNEEVRRREKVIRIFPHVQSATRLIGSVLMDINEEWLSSGRAYIKIKKE